jgi:hypothetical protein
MSRRQRLTVVMAVFVAATLAAGAAGAFTDFGSFVQDQLRHRSQSLFGVSGPLASSSTTSLSATETAAHPERLATVARSLNVRVVSHGVAAPNLELIDPLHTTGVSLDRATGTFSGGSGAANLTARPALGRLSFEGLAIYPSGVTYFGDENRPAQGVGGGAYFKFIPASLRDPGAGAITTLADSPCASPGNIYGLRLGLRLAAPPWQIGSSTRTPRPSRPCKAPTTTTCGTASPTGSTPICRATAASASPP